MLAIQILNTLKKISEETRRDKSLFKTWSLVLRLQLAIAATFV